MGLCARSAANDEHGVGYVSIEGRERERARWLALLAASPLTELAAKSEQGPDVRPLFWLLARRLALEDVDGAGAAEADDVGEAGLGAFDLAGLGPLVLT